MKTALQEIIEKLNYSIKNSTDTHKVNFAWIKFHCELLLEKEKNQIINAYSEAFLLDEDDISVEDANKFADRYYNDQFN